MLRWFHIEKTGRDCSSYLPGLYTISELDQMIFVDGYIPVANAFEIDKIRTGNAEKMGEGTCWEKPDYVTGGDKKYVQVLEIDFTSFGVWSNYVPYYEDFVFDANELKWLNLNSTTGIFSMGGGASTFDILNLRISGANLVTNSGSVGIVVNAQLASFKFTNCIVFGDINGGGNLGSLLGSKNGYNVSSITDCFFSGEVISTENSFGGLVGIVRNGGVTFTNCECGAGSTIHSTVAGICGGIAGLTEACELINCVNYAKVDGTIRVAGVVGHARKKSLLTNCINYGEVNGEAQGTGGVTGGGAGGNISILIDCQNYGNVYGEGIVGGIAGYIVVGGGMTKCKNQGNVTGKTGAGYVGGLFGTATSGTNTAYVKECFVTDCEIKNGQRAGGMGGQTGGVRFEDCRVSETVQVYGASHATGGIAGGAAGSNGTVTWENCYSAAYLPSGSGRGGLVGAIYSGSLTVTNCYWDKTNFATSPRGIGKTTIELQTPTSPTGIFSDYDPAIWGFGTSSQYPYLLNTP